MSLAARALEISEFLGQPPDVCLARLQRGFFALHHDVAADFRAANPKTHDDLLNWYRTTEAYIWELSAYHEDPGFNYSGMCSGIAQHLLNDHARSVLCLGDGIGDLTLTLARAGLDSVYHDLHGSRTAEFAMSRFAKSGLPIPYCVTDGWTPDFPVDEYDAVVSLDYLEHVTDVPAWTQAIYDALRPGGIFGWQNAFNCGSGENGSIPCHLSINDKYEKEWAPLLKSIGFVQESGNWARKPA